MENCLTDKDYRLFVSTVRQVSEFDFTNYSEKSMKRLIAKVLADNGNDVKALVTEIGRNRKFLERVVKRITVNTTDLFRDTKVWQEIRYRILPDLKSLSTISIWHAGCSTGQEVYSMLILLNELGLFDQARVMASDINSDVLEIARSGVYRYRFNRGYFDNFDEVICRNPLNIEEKRNVPWSKYFTVDREKDILAVKPFLMKKPVFRQHDLVSGEQFSPGKFDIIVCRNVVIYFNAELQNRIFERFWESLHPGGYLVIGLHETLSGPVSSRFEKKGLVYRKPNNVLKMM